MAKLSAHGRERLRIFDERRCMLRAYMEDGQILGRTIHSNGWRIIGRVKDGKLDERVTQLSELMATWPAWKRGIKSLPSLDKLQHWHEDGGCETPSGKWTEPDGTGPDGEPSWLRLLGLI